MHIHNTLIKLSCVCISTHMQLLCLSVAQRTVDLLSLVSNRQVGLVMLQTLSGENHLNDAIAARLRLRSTNNLDKYQSAASLCLIR